MFGLTTEDEYFFLKMVFFKMIFSDYFRLKQVFGECLSASFTFFFPLLA